MKRDDSDFAAKPIKVKIKLTARSVGERLVACTNRSLQLTVPAPSAFCVKQKER